MGRISGGWSWRRRPGACAWNKVNGFLFITASLAAFLIGSYLCLAALGLLFQARQLHQAAQQHQQAAMLGRQAMEAWKGGSPLEEKVSLQGKCYDVQRREAMQDGWIVRTIEVGDEHGKIFSCSSLVTEKEKEERLGSDGSSDSRGLYRPDADGPAAGNPSDGRDGSTLSD
ncbi:hypothetical protein [uncultured Megasphaera sp.]|uniref:hypothetical protein n=1 Tax=uncultured Megasphaera sp. TaxID=165188 RepID=UPI0028044C99|nr:hypothetical protein [uncultured Megasphaera sp.]